MNKITVQYFEPADAEEFESNYRARHVPLVQALPGLERFTLSRPRGIDAPHLVAELWFADSESMKTALKSPEMAAAAADAETYAVARQAMFTGTVEDLPYRAGE